MVDYQGNSNKDKEPKGKKEKEKPKKVVTKVVTGDVIRKPRGIGRKFKDVFLGGDARSAAVYVLADVLLPAMRDMAVDVVTRGTERIVYGESGYRNRRSNLGPRVQYNRGYGGNPLDRGYNPREPYARETVVPPRSKWRNPRLQHLDDIIIPAREEAEGAVTMLLEIIEQYDVASVADYYETLGLESSAIDNKWGWTYLNNVQVRQVRQGYVIDLPPAEEL